MKVAGGAGAAAAPGSTVADVIEQLMAEFEDRFELPVISRTVLGCRADLDCSPATALPELIERLARQRLLDGGPGPVVAQSLPEVPSRPAPRQRA